MSEWRVSYIRRGYGFQFQSGRKITIIRMKAVVITMGIAVSHTMAEAILRLPVQRKNTDKTVIELIVPFTSHR